MNHLMLEGILVRRGALAPHGWLVSGSFVFVSDLSKFRGFKTRAWDYAFGTFLEFFSEARCVFYFLPEQTGQGPPRGSGEGDQRQENNTMRAGVSRFARGAERRARGLTTATHGGIAGQKHGVCWSWVRALSRVPACVWHAPFPTCAIRYTGLPPRGPRNLISGEAF